MALIACENLSIGYENKVLAREINFSISKGEYLCIIGENGAGKSTLMKTILGLIPSISGEIVRGDDLAKNDIAYLPQQNIIQKDFPASVNEIVLSGNLNKHKFQPFYSKKDREKAESNLEKMGILKLKNKSFRELSGGQQQRVLLARALCATSKLLLVDEPVASLDPKATLELYELFKDLNYEGLSIIMISHDMKALDFASHVLYMGKNEFFARVEDFKDSRIYENILERGVQ